MTAEATIYPVTGKKGKGYLHIVTDETVFVEQIVGEIFFMTKGEISPTKKKIATFTAVEHQEFRAGQNYEIDFEFELPEDAANTYKSNKISCMYRCKFTAEVAEDPTAPQNIRTKIGSFFSKNPIDNMSTYFEVAIPQVHYKAVEGRTPLFEPNGMNSGLLIFLVILGIPVGLATYISIMGSEFLFEFIILKIFIMIAIMLILIYLYLRQQKKIREKISLAADINHIDAQSFSVQLTQPHATFVAKKCAYKVIEKVVDRRGTSSRTYIQTLYASDKQLISDNAPIIFNYPTHTDWQTRQHNDYAKIYWEITVFGKYKSVTSKMQVEFVTNRVTDETPDTNTNSVLNFG